MSNERSTPHYAGPERREPNGAFAGWPVWARIAAVLGVPSVIALFLVWVGSQSIPKMQSDIIALRFTVQTIQMSDEEKKVRDAEMRRLLQIICSSSLKTEQEKLTCFAK